jgi:uncharacterized membrane protein YtjA (UPF0391 family)
MEPLAGSRSFSADLQRTDLPVRDQRKEHAMLKWALIFFVVAIIAAAFGFTGIAAGAAGIAKILFFLFVALFVVMLLLGLFAGRAATR